MGTLSEFLSGIVGHFASMTPLELFAQVLGLLGIGISLLIYAGRTRARILVCKFISDVLWSGNYFLVGAYTGALLNVIAMGRETVFYHRETKKWAGHRAWLYVFIVVTLLSPILEFVKIGGFSWRPLLPAVGSVLAVISFYSRRPRVMRYFGLAAQILWLTYGILIVNVTSILCGLFTILSAVIGMIREWRAKEKTGEA